MNPFDDSDSDCEGDGDGDDDEFMPRGQREDPTKGKPNQKKFSPKAEKNSSKEGEVDPEKPKVRSALLITYYLSLLSLPPVSIPQPPQP